MCSQTLRASTSSFGWTQGTPQMAPPPSWRALSGGSRKLLENQSTVPRTGAEPKAHAKIGRWRPPEAAGDEV